MKPSLFAVSILMLTTACGSAADVSSGRAPTTIPLFDSVETTDTTGTDSTDSTVPVSTTGAATSLVSTSSADSSALSSTSEVDATATTSTTSAPTTTTTVDVNAEYCAAYNDLIAMDTTITPGDTDATAVVFAAREAAWIETAALAPAAISTEARIVRDFVSALRQLLADNGNDLGAVLFEAVDLEAELGADVAQIVVEQFGLLQCGSEASDTEQETAVFYASLLDSADRRSVLAELLSTDGALTVDQANCFVASATAEMMFPLTGAPSTAAQDAALGQLLGVCQLSAGGS